ncbi:MAG: undecaprenyldiphospho-muramoylpentapeptide beta-N-acetylglucosaminyltransferase [Bacteroidales bacterium]|jgi:UDP-N-acetylglucosamine--N-acetylmuramyl-(pentapeptide) pyrophosphoryl-undecaprenol N-acetylglucosamine transferase|nr:undecaprenyldiphospho-muramoylpentapeptide beta-N-acetylglucosaminyltransferase [Bacteroidales bacterium]
MENTKRTKKFIVSGGGTGGHIFPAIAIANCLKRRYKDCEILFVGAIGKMEMQKVPQAGYKIEGLKIAGFQRKKLWKNITLPYKVISCLMKAKKIIKDFNPDIVIGVGGYASGPTLKQAANQGIPTLLQEQNSYAGVTNKILAKKAKRICVAYENMDRFFDKDKIVFTGNPIRKTISSLRENEELLRENAKKNFLIEEKKPVVLVVGGSLGARTINNGIEKHLQYFIDNNIQLLWQTGKFYYKDILERTKNIINQDIKINEFIYDMDQAYSIADVVISRSGALSISELCVVGKPTILVPSPNVAEDHQTKNAMALVNKDASIMIKDIDFEKDVVSTLDNLLKDKQKQESLSKNILSLGITNADELIVDEIEKIIK